MMAVSGTDLLLPLVILVNELNFGDELRRLRREAKKTLADLAAALEVSVVYISQIERGDRSPPPNAAIKILLKEVGRLDVYQAMSNLASASRMSVEISLKDKTYEQVELFASLARRSDEGELSDETVRKIRAILDRPGSN